MTAPKSLRELFEQLGLHEVPSTDGTVTMEMASTNEPSTPPVAFRAA
jgi:hypothetical protein